MGGFISRLFRGASRRRRFCLLVNQMFCQKCTKQMDSRCSCLPSTLHCCSSPERERSSIQQFHKLSVNCLCHPGRWIRWMNLPTTRLRTIVFYSQLFWLKQIPAPLFPCLLRLSCHKHISNLEDSTEKKLFIFLWQMVRVSQVGEWGIVPVPAPVSILTSLSIFSDVIPSAGTQWRLSEPF